MQHALGRLLSINSVLSCLALVALLTACSDDPEHELRPVPVTSLPATATPEPTPQPSQDFPSTLREYRRLAELNPAGRESMIEEVIVTLNEDIIRDSTSVDAYVKRGVAYTAMYNYSGPERDESFIEQAMADFAEAIDLDPTNPSAYIGRGEGIRQLESAGQGRPRVQHSGQASHRVDQPRSPRYRCAYRSRVRL